MSNFNKEQGTIAAWIKNTLPQPVHHWKLNEPANGLILHNRLGSQSEVENSVIGQDGTVEGTTDFALSKFNNGARINGNGEYIRFGSVPIGSAGCMEMWITPAFTPPDSYTHFLVYFDTDGSPNDLQWYISGGGLLKFRWGGPTDEASGLVTSMTSGNTYHVAAVWDQNGIDGTADKLRVYFEGNMLDSDTSIGAQGRTIDNLNLGNDYNTNEYINGVIGNFKYWNYAKTDFSDRNTEDTTMEQWAQPIDIGSSPVNGLNNGALVGQDGYRGKSYYFNGISSKVTMPADTASFERTDAFTLCGWVKGASGDSLSLFDKFDNPGTEQGYLFMKTGGNDKLHFVLSNDYDGGVNVINITADNVMSVFDAWVHIAVTYDGSSSASGVKIYENGVEIPFTASFDTLSATTISPVELKIGVTDWPTWSEGNIQDNRIYDSELSGDQVKQLYQDTRYIISANSLPAPMYRVVLDKPFVEETGDLSAIFNNTSAVFNTDDIRKSYKFNGSAYIRGQNDLHASVQGANPKTLCAWVKIGTFVSDSHIASFGTYTPSSQFDISTLSAGGGDQFSFHGNSADITETTARSLNVWYHVCATYDGSTVILYVDSIEVGSLTTALTTAAGPLRIGERADGGGTKWGANGCIANVHVYNSCLTPEQIKTVMNEQESFELKIDEKTSLIKSSVNENVENGLVMWNKLGSEKEIVNSEVGGPAIKPNYTAYVYHTPAKFGQGLYVGCNNVAITDPPRCKAGLINQDCFTMEYWFKSMVEDLDYQYVIAPKNTTDGSNESLVWIFYETGIASHWTLYVDLRNAGTIVARYHWDFTNQAGWESFIDYQGDFHHWALVVDINESVGSRIKVYKDGTQYTAVSPTIDTELTVSAGYTTAEQNLFQGRLANQGMGGIVDNFKIWNKAKTDFSDRNEEYPTHILKPMQRYEIGEVREPEGLTLHNQLGNPYQVQNSVVGPNLDVVGALSFGDGKFGQAYVGSANNGLDWDGTQTFPSDGSVGSYEIWYYPTTGFDATSHWLVGLYNDVAGGGHISIVGIASSGMQWVYQQRGSSIFTLSYQHPWSNFTIGTWYHLALVWDENGIDGGSNTVRAYFNGSIVASTDTALTKGTITATTCRLANGFTTPATEKLIGRIDNFKAYNYAKTDFSDRFTEFPQGLVLESGSVDLNKWTHMGMSWQQRDMVTPADADGLVLWNKLGSLSQIQNSEVGPNGSTFLTSTYPTYEIGVFGNCSYFDAGTKGIKFTMPWDNVGEKKLGTDEITIELWAKPALPLPTNPIVFALGNASVATGIAAIVQISSSVLRFDTFEEPTSGSPTASRDISYTWDSSNFHHFAVSISTTQVKLYIDGLLINTWDVRAAFVGNPIKNELFIGCWSNGSIILQPYRGCIDNLKVWDYCKFDFSDRFYEAPQEVTKKLYINGQKQIESTSNGLLREPFKHALFGSDTLKRNQGGMLCDKIYIGKRELSETEVRQLYNSINVR